MKKTKLLLFLSAILLALGLVAAHAVAADPAPSLSIEALNLSVENAVHMVFKVADEGVDAADIKLLVWETVPAEYKKGTEKTVLTASETEADTGYTVFRYTDLAAKDMTKTVYVCAYARVNGVDVYSAPTKYSIVMYAYLKKNATTPNIELCALLDSMLAYGAAAQTYFGHNTGFLATDEVHKVTVVNGRLSDGFSLGWVKEGTTVTVTANAPAEGYVFSHWADATGTPVSTDATYTLTATKSETYTAVYKVDPTFYTEGLAFDLSSDGTYYTVTGYRGTATAVVIPATYEGKPVKEIGFVAFYLCDSLTSVEIPDSVTTIGDHAFDYCTSLTSVEIPDSVTSIGGYAFANCTGLVSITVDANNPNYSSIDGNLYNKDATTLIQYAIGKTDTSVTIPDSVTSIGGWAFAYCTSLTSVEIPDSVTSIGSYAFYSCDSLASVEIPDSVTSIGDYAFYNCTSLTSVEIPASVTSIGINAFRDCTSLTSVEIPDSVTSIGGYAFANCTGLVSITVDANNPNYSSIDGNLYNKDATTLIQYAIGKTDTSFVLPDSVTSIGGVAFWGCDSLTSVMLPDSVTSIGDYAFRECTSLASIVIPDDVASIGKYAFYECTSLTTVHYGGADAEAWGEITVKSYNEKLTSATRYYYSENQPCAEGSFWHYVDGVPTVWTTFGHSYDNACDADCNFCGEMRDVSHTDENGDGYCDICGSYEQPFYTEGLVFTLSGDGTYYSVTDYTGTATDVVIPASYEGKPVKEIGYEAFRDCRSLTSVTFGENSQLTSIGSSAFRDCTSLMSIDIPDSVTSIGDYAFRNCDSLTSVEIPDSVTSIGYEAFAYCDSLASVTFGENSQLTSIGERVFYNCTSLTSIDIPDSVTSIGDSAFYYCTSLTSVVIPASVTSIGSGAFYACSSLTSIDIPDSVTSIGYVAFNNCTSLTSVVIGDSVTSIGHNAFYCCSSLTSITVDTDNASYCSIDGNLYNKNATILIQYAIGKTDTSFAIPDSVTSIGSAAFANCTSLTSVEIPDSVTSIGSYAFGYCTSLTSITVDANNPNYSSIDGNLYNKDATTLIQYAIGKTDTSFAIPDSVTSIGSSAFRDCTSLTSVTIPDSVTSIGDYAFMDCSSLTSVTFGENSQLTSIGSYAFMDCDSLTSIDIPDSVTSIGEGAFYSCNSLTSVEIPDSVTSIGYVAFDGCTSLTTVYYGGADEALWNAITIKGNNTDLTDATRYYYSENQPCAEGSFWHYVDGVPAAWTTFGHSYDNACDADCNVCGDVREVAHTDEDGNSYCDICGSYEQPFYTEGLTFTLSSDRTYYTVTGYTGSATDVIIPASYEGKPVESIGERAFQDCSSLTSVEIPDSVTSIGGYAFSSCTSLTSVEIPDSVTSIGSSAFRGCDSLTSIDIPDSVTSIGEGAFYSCNSLTSVTFGENSQLTSIGSYAFAYCRSLTSVTIPDSVTSVGEGAFDYCDSLASIVIPDSVTSIGDHAFWYCTSLTSIDIPDSVTSIGNSAFRHCESLTSVEIPDSVTSIGYYAFYSCDSLTSVTIPDSVTSIGSDAFAYCDSLTTVFYGGADEALWNAITIEGSNTALTNATRYYYSENQPCAEGSFWHYVDGVPTVWTTFGHSYDNACDADCNVCGEMRDVSHTDENGDGYCDICGSYEQPFYTEGLTFTLSSDGTYYTVTDYTGSATAVVIPASYEGKPVTSIGNYAFANCDSLTNVEIPDSVTSIGSYAFGYCTSLTSITVDANNPNYSSIDGNLYNKDATTLIQYAIGKTDTSFAIPDSVMSIGDAAFFYCTSLTSVTFDENSQLTSIGDYAFWYCTSLTSVEIPDSVTSIGSSAFMDCDSLTSVEIPASVTSIGYGAFYDCDSLTSVTIPDSVTSIGNEAFYDCDSLTSVTIPNSVTSIGNYAFRGCTSLTSVYYGGADAEAWSEITIGSYNDSLTNATRYYYSETQPTVEGSFWHYVDGVPTVWVTFADTRI